MLSFIFIFSDFVILHSGFVIPRSGSKVPIPDVIARVGLAIRTR